MLHVKTSSSIPSEWAYPAMPLKSRLLAGRFPRYRFDVRAGVIGPARSGDFVRADEENWAMSETRTLLTKISALRQRLDQVQGLADEARSAATALLAGLGDDPAEGVSFETAIRAAADQDTALD